MIKIFDKSSCCGCSACASACPVGCIEMEDDSEGFAYPSVDVNACVECGRCQSVCPFVNTGVVAPVSSCHAARTQDQVLLRESSSGGVFTELCKPVLDAGGVVYGVVMDADCRGCSFARAENADELAPMRGSKYIQANSRGVYERVAEDVRNGRKVLFSGTPCQVNALSRYLGGGRDGLLLVDCICHGVPSPRLWAASVVDLEAKNGARVISVSFRCKEVSWRRFGHRAVYGGKALFQPLEKSPYLRMFLKDVCLRESCYSCAAKGERAADVTIADFWGIESVVPEMSDELGCSLVIVRTPRGAVALAGIQDAILSKEVPYDAAVRSNPAVSKSARRPPEREAFFRDLESVGYAGVVQQYATSSIGTSAREKSKRVIKNALAKVGLLKVANKLRGVLPESMMYGLLITFSKPDANRRKWIVIND